MCYVPQPCWFLTLPRAPLAFQSILGGISVKLRYMKGSGSVCRKSGSFSPVYWLLNSSLLMPENLFNPNLYDFFALFDAWTVSRVAKKLLYCFLLASTLILSKLWWLLHLSNKADLLSTVSTSLSSYVKPCTTTPKHHTNVTETKINFLESISC